MSEYFTSIIISAFLLIEIIIRIIVNGFFNLVYVDVYILIKIILFSMFNYLFH